MELKMIQQVPRDGGFEKFQRDYNALADSMHENARIILQDRGQGCMAMMELKVDDFANHLKAFYAARTLFTGIQFDKVEMKKTITLIASSLVILKKIQKAGTPR